MFAASDTGRFVRTFLSSFRHTLFRQFPFVSQEIVMLRTIRVLLALIMTCFVSSKASGADILDNTSQGTGTIASIQSGGYISGFHWGAITVANASDVDLDLSTMTIGLFSQDAGTYDMFIELWSVVDGQPDTWIPDQDKQETVVSTSAGETLFLEIDICTFTLPANASRAFVIWTNAEDLTLSWQGMDGNAAPSGSMGVNYLGSWTSFPETIGEWSPVVGGVNFSLGLTGTPVPEPSTYVLACIAAGAFVCHDRKRGFRRTS
jgi:hypothetical protein